VLWLNLLVVAEKRKVLVDLLFRIHNERVISGFARTLLRKNIIFQLKFSLSGSRSIATLQNGQRGGWLKLAH